MTGEKVPSVVARFNGGMVDGPELAKVLREYLPTSHPFNMLEDVVQVAWERGAITDTRFNEVSAALETLRESVTS